MILLAGRLSLLDATAEERLLPRLSKSRTRLVVGGVMNSGVLLENGLKRFNYNPAPAEVIQAAAAVRDIVREAGMDLVSTATHYPLRYPQVASVLVGADNGFDLRLGLAEPSSAPDEALMRALAPHRLRAASLAPG